MAEKKTQQGSRASSRYCGRAQKKVQEVRTKGLTPSGPHTPATPNSRNRTADHLASNISLDKFEERLNEIKPYVRLPYEKLPVGIMRTSDGLIHILNLSSEDDKAVLLAHARRVFEMDTLEGLVPGSLLSKFFGCQATPCQGVDLGCSPLCAGSVGSDPKKTGWSQCSSPVLEFQDGHFKTFSAGQGDSNKSAYIYVKSDFRGFMPEHIKELHHRNIFQVRLIQYDSSTNKCTQASPSFVPVENFIIKNTGIAQVVQNNMHTSGMFGVSTGVAILILVVLVAIIIGLLFWASRRRSGSGSSTPSSPSPRSSYSGSKMYSGMTPRFPFRNMVPE